MRFIIFPICLILLSGCNMEGDLFGPTKAECDAQRAAKAAYSPFISAPMRDSDLSDDEREMIELGACGRFHMSGDVVAYRSCVAAESSKAVAGRLSTHANPVMSPGGNPRCRGW